MKKKITAVLLACVLAAGLTAAPAGTVTALAEEEPAQKTEDGFSYRVNGEEITITRYSGTAAKVVIPESIDGKKVTGIGENAFLKCSSLTSVEIPDGVTSIGSMAFRECGSLTGIAIPDSVTSIGEYAFSRCRELTGMITIPGGVTSIETSAFSGCSSLTGIVISNGVTSIGEGAFSGCSSLTDVKIPNSVTSIGSSAFNGCSSLSSVSIPESVAHIGANVFENTPWLEEQFSQNGGLAIVNRIVIDADETISGNIIVPDNVTRIEASAFSNCGQLTGIQIPDGVTGIGRDAFYGCQSLKNIEIPDNVMSIGECAFNGCSGLTSITIPANVTSIEEETFFNCISLISVEIPGSVTSIRENAFKGCRSLTDLSISGGLTSIGESAFTGCSGLTSIDLPNGVTDIGTWAFRECGSLSSVVIPESVARMGASVFEGTPWLEEQLKEKGGLLIVNQIVIDSTENLSGNITIPENVTCIAGLAFSGCSGLTGIEIPDSVTSIGEAAFQSCSGLTSVKIPEGVTSLEAYVFAHCSKLTDVYIPVSVTRIGRGVFGECSGLKDIYYAGNGEQWRQIEQWDGEFYPSVTIHFGSTESDFGAGGSAKANQFITAENITKTYGAKTFPIGAKSTGGAALSYTVSNPKVAAVDGGGNVTIKGYGVTDITITAAETDAYHKAQKTIRLTVKPKKMTLSFVKSKKKKTATVKWKKDKNASGYRIECATDKKFKKNRVKTVVRRNKTVTATIKKLKPGKKYYVRICAYAESGDANVQGDWSKAKTIKIKK